MAASGWAAYSLAHVLPYLPIDVRLSSSVWLTFQLDVMRCAWAVLPAAILWGTSFPLALASVASAGQDSGRLVGGVYAANTVGAIVGALGFSLVASQWLGMQQAQRLLIVFAAISSTLMFVAYAWRRADARFRAGRPWSRTQTGSVVGAALVGLTASAAVLWLAVPRLPAGVIGFGRTLAIEDGSHEFVYVGEGRSASIAVSKLPDGVKNFHVSGKIVASSSPLDMRLQRMLGHLPALVHPRPRSVLIVGCGAGVTAGSFVTHPHIERIVICEIEPLIPAAAGKHFKTENYGVVDDPRVEIIYDDARHFLLTTRESFDIITSDPIHPWVKGAAALYSTEYFELCKRRLNPGGVVTQWVPLYESNLAAVKSEIATFLDAFPSGTIWSNDLAGEGYDIVLLGQSESTHIDVGRLQTRLARDDHFPVSLSLSEVGFGSGLELLATYAGRRSDLVDWLANAELNRDSNLRLQFLAGMGLNSYHESLIYQTIVMHRRFPDDLFTSQPELVEELKTTLSSHE